MDKAELTVDSATLDGERGLPSRSRTLERGSVIGRYVVLAPVGAGGMGLVFAAHDPELDRKVALKVLREDSLRTDATEGRRKLLREAQALARLAHPNVVVVHDVGVDQGRSFIAMEFIVGQTLRQWLDGKTRTTAEVLAVFIAAGRGLAAAHAGGIVHGDFKPQNVLIADDGRVLVTDFGLARPLEPEASVSVSGAAFEDTMARVSTNALTPTSIELGEIAGTPAYMAPEQFVGSPASALSDQFAFAVALWEGLAGRRPFHGGSLPALIAAIAQGRLDEASVAKIPRWLRPALRRALSSKHEQRFASLDPLLEAITNDPARRRRRLAAVGLAGVLAMGGAGTWWLMQRAAHEACTADGASISEVVDAGALTAVREALLRTSSGIAVEAADHADRALSAYAASWSTMRRDNCDAHLDGERSDLYFTRAQSCLDDARVALTELMGALRRVPDRPAVAAMAGAITALPLLAACDDEQRLATRVPLPEQSGPRERVLEVRRRLAKLDIARRLGSAEDEGTLPALEVLVDEARAVDWPPLLPEVLLEQARHLGATRDFAASVTAGKQAFLAALAANDDDIAAESAAQLALIIGLEQMHLDEGADWLDIADTLYDRVGEHGYPRTTVLAHRSKLAEAQGHMPEALAFAEQALARRTEVVGEGHPLLAPLLGAVGHQYQELGDHTRALTYFEQELAAIERAIGGPHADIPETLGDMASVYAAQGKLDEAERMYTRALAMNDRIRGPNDVSRAYLLNNAAMVYDDVGRLDDALTSYDDALALFEATYGPGHPLVGAVLANTVIALLKSGRPEEAKQRAEQSVQVRETALGKDHPDVAGSLNGLSDAQRELGLFEDARRSAARSVAIREAALEPDDLALVASRGTLGEALIALGEYGEAAVQLGTAIESSRKRLGDTHEQIAILLRQLAKAEVGLGRTVNARQTLQRTLELWERDPTAGLLAAEVAFALAKLEWDAGDGARARELGERARDHLRNAGPSAAGDLAEVEQTLTQWRESPEPR